MPELFAYVDERGRKPFEERFAGLKAQAAAKIASAATRLELGNFSKVESVGAGVLERKIDFGPGYRIYFGKGRRRAGDPARRRLEEDSAGRHQDG